MRQKGSSRGTTVRKFHRPANKTLPEILEGMAVAVAQVDRAKFTEEVKTLPMPDLMKRFAREAGIHRNMLLRRGTGLSPTWRDLRRFLLDLGPCPSDDHLLGFTSDDDVTYAPGRAKWMPSKDVAAQEARQAEVGARALAEAQAADWRRNPKKNALLPPRAAPKAAEPARPAAAVERTDASLLIDETSPWLPADAERRDAFLKIYRAWHGQVLAQYTRSATPAFLYAFSALPVLKKCRDDLTELDLWDPLTEAGHQAKEVHPAWKKYCEFLPRASAALQEIGTYSDYSIFSQLDELIERVVKAEQRFREGPDKRPGLRAPPPQMRVKPA